MPFKLNSFEVNCLNWPLKVFSGLIGFTHPATNSYHQDYDMFSNKQATLINLPLATVTRWGIDPMDWIGTTNIEGSWRFMFQWAEMSNTSAENGAAENSTNARRWDSSGWIYIPIEYTNLDLKTCFVCCVFFFVFISPKLHQDLDHLKRDHT